MDLSFSEMQRAWQERAAGFVRSCAPAPGDIEAGQDWLRATAADARVAGILDAARPGRTGSPGLDLLTLFLMAEELARLDAGMALAFVNRSLCYRTSSLLLSEAASVQLAERLREPGGPFDAVAMLPESGAWLDEDERLLHLEEDTSLAQPETAVCVGWTGSAGFTMLNGATQRTAEAAAVPGFRTVRLHRVAWKAHDDGMQAVLCRTANGHFRYSRAIAGAEYRLLMGAVLLGLAQSALDYSLDYSRRRVAFGKPLCLHQAVSLHFAAMATGIESARLMLWECCAAPNPAQADRYFAWSGRAAVDAARRACQLLGGHGFLTDHPTALWLREIRILLLLGAAPGNPAGVS
jgi:alkylation response protein AidB-like acyl-CoA dehydrogenase